MKIAALCIYPVKGLRAWPVEQASVEPWGLAGDRRWVVVDERGKALTQREHPDLARFVVRPSRGSLLISIDQEELAVPYPASEEEDLRVFSNPAKGAPADAEASRWLSDALGRQVRLLHMSRPDTARALRAPGTKPGQSMSYADEYPVLLASLSSLTDLNLALGESPVGMERFRPNVVVEDLDPWVEEGWDEVKLGHTWFRAPSSCRRCVVITVNQDTGRIDEPGQPLKTLTRLNRGGEGFPLFGRNLVPADGGIIRVGDDVHGISHGAGPAGPPCW